MLRAFVIAAALAAATFAAHAKDIRLGSAHAIVVDEDTGEVLLGKDTETAAPIASLTKLMTAMVVLDAGQDADERLRISEDDMDHLKHTRFGLPVGATATRGAMLELALIASDNHAAHALARHYPGGLEAFRAAVRAKIVSLGLHNTLIEEPTGLSPANRSSAQDMARLVKAASTYPVIEEITSKRRHAVEVNGRQRAVNNTNRLVGAPGWNILLSKTGFTNEAGRCVTMRLEAAGRRVMVVLMGAAASSQRALDALAIRRFVSGESPALAEASDDAPPKSIRKRAKRARV
jgi:serine-type D-Ala-D-Ala endopeptidase (penicillin-binding protein 7)